MAQKPPIQIEAPSLGTSKPATFIFLHGYGDDAEGWINIAQQFHSANKLPHLSWIFPNAPHNHEAMTNAWYTPTSFSPIPVGRSNPSESKEDDEEFAEEGEDEILQSVEYLCSLIDEEVKKGVDINRIVIGGFSQGCAISLCTALGSRYGGRIGGVVGLSGYLPRGKKLRREREGFVGIRDWETGDRMRVFMGHGTRDMLVPMRVFRDAKSRIEKVVGEEVMECREYEGMGHVTSGVEFRDMCQFLERVVPG